MAESYRKLSRIDWHQPAGETTSTTEQIQLGALLRIADATELMAKRYQELINERDRYKEWYDTEATHRHQLDRRLAAAKGRITKLKKMITPPDPQINTF